MKIGYARVSTADQNLDLQINALNKAGVENNNIYYDKVTGKKSKRPGLDNCLKHLRSGDTLIVWKLDRLGRDLKDLIKIVNRLNEERINFKVLTGLEVDTSTSSGRLMFHIFSSLAQYERELISERTKAALGSARQRGKVGGAKRKVTKSMIRRMQAAMSHRDTNVSELARELKITKQTIYRYVDAKGNLRKEAEKVLKIEK